MYVFAASPRKWISTRLLLSKIMSLGLVVVILYLTKEKQWKMVRGGFWRKGKRFTSFISVFICRAVCLRLSVSPHCRGQTWEDLFIWLLPSKLACPLDRWLLFPGSSWAVILSGTKQLEGQLCWWSIHSPSLFPHCPPSTLHQWIQFILVSTQISPSPFIFFVLFFVWCKCSVWPSADSSEWWESAGVYLLALFISALCNHVKMKGLAALCSACARLLLGDLAFIATDVAHSL